ncbi:TonB-linked outer membrane protein, SusC/RagA family [Chryseolinea serpens]|uniref:TonB-linked outer membrane protein, SusC/RagA family n=1 Tax=Chryseolinea serpens TaxID=947013 RepID=A0A1M5JJT1_9BACT|nr:TonB-dependent receptor [Chryseolinea serpens]SHG40530.1 TonB-linked outer membrane protein, SusC/RagA family [Chryseolinea serpens]
MMERLHNTGKAFLLVWLCMLCIAARANEPPKATAATVALEKAISGKVTGDGEALPGASVVVKGTAIGATTDAEGSFRLSVPDDATTIVISYIGYVSQEISIGTQTVFNVALIADVATLGDIVVVGYGVQKKSDLTGAIASVKGDELAQLPTQRVDQALQGRAAGVMVLNQSGAPGGNTTIRIRGSSSILGSNQPLIVIDGLQGGDLNSLNPNDVESMEVLKDASATAIYGSQGANGVILVTTKKGKKGHPVVSYSYNLGVQKLRNKLDVMSGGDFARTINDFKASQDQPGNVVITPTPVFTADQIAGYDKAGFGTDWQKEVYRSAAMQNHQLSVSGGGENVQYLVSGGYLNQQGILLNSSFKRFSLRANVNVDITKWASFGLSWAGIKETGNTPPFGEGAAIIDPLGQVVSVAPRWNATIPVYDENGNYSKHPSGYGEPNMWNPVASAKEAYTENNSIRNNINAFLDFKIAKGLTFRITGGAITRNQNNFRYLNNNTFAGFQKNGQGNVDDNIYTRYQNSNILTYDKSVGRHHFVITGVAEQQVEQNKGMSILANDFLVDQAGIYDLGGASSVVPSSFNTKRVINSFLGRVNYSFADKYLLTASYRADGSSVFGANNKWGYFPSASVAWRISEEGFLQDVDAITDLKLRASWGVTGNQAISPYASLSQLRATADTRYPYNGGSVTDIGMDIVRAANPNLKWESTTQTDIGIDLGLFNGRLNLTADYYVKTTEDLLLSRQLPTYTGFPNIIDNVGSTRNKGIELSIGGDPLVGPLRWNTSFNISGNRSKVLKLTDANKLPFRTTPGAGYGISTNANTALLYLQEGQPFGQMTGWITEGTWSESDRDKAAAFGQLPGDIHYKDVNGDGLINNKDLTVIGNAFPKFIFGWNNRFSFKNFDLSFLIQGVQGNDLFNLNRVRLERPGEGTSTALMNRWTPDNQDTDVPAFTKQSVRKAAGLTNKVTVGDQRLSRWVEDASYIRLKNITFAYNFPQTLTRKVGMNRLRLYVSGQNLFTITKYTGYDPEVSSFNTNDANIGVDFANYPTSKVYTMGIDLTF